MHPSLFAGAKLDQSLRQAWYPSSLLYDGLALAFAEVVMRSLPSATYSPNNPPIRRAGRYVPGAR